MAINPIRGGGKFFAPDNVSGGSRKPFKALKLHPEVVAKLVFRSQEFRGRTSEQRSFFEWYPLIALYGVKDLSCSLPCEFDGIIVVENDRDLLGLLKTQLRTYLAGIDIYHEFVNLDQTSIWEDQDFVVLTASKEAGFGKVAQVVQDGKRYLVFMDGNLGYQKITGETITADIRGESQKDHIIIGMSSGAQNNFEILRAGGNFVLLRREFNAIFPLLFGKTC